jgi:hypothetical protein
MSKLRVTVSVEDDSGKTVATSESAREVPDLGGFESQGFRKAFGELENAVLDARKEASDGVVEQYLENMSKKKRAKLPQDLGTPE